MAARIGASASGTADAVGPLDSFDDEFDAMRAYAERALRMAALRRSIPPHVPELATAIARQFPWIAPGVATALAFANAPADVIAEAGVRSAQVAVDRGDFRPPGNLVPPTPDDRVRAANVQSPLRSLFSNVAGGISGAASMFGSDVRQAGQAVARGAFAVLESPLQEVSGVVQEALVAARDPNIEFSEVKGTAAPSTLQQAWWDYRRTGEVDLGAGILPAGQVEQTRQRKAAEFAMNVPEIVEAYGHLADQGELFVSPGRLLALEVTQPGTRSFQVASGLVDLGFNLVADPSSYALGGFGKARAATKVFGAGIEGTQGLARVAALSRAAFPRASERLASVGIIPGARPVVIADEVTHWMRASRQGREAVRWLTDHDDFYEVWQAFGRKVDRDTVRLLADAADEDTVRDVLLRGYTGALDDSMQGRILREKFSAPTGLRAQVKKTARQVRFLNMVPHANVDVEDVDKGLETLYRAARNAKLTEDQVRTRVNQFAAADTYEHMHAAVNDLFADVAVKLSGDRWTRDIAYKVTKRITGWHTNFRAFDVDEMTGRHRGGVGERLDMHGEVLPSAFVLTEFMHRAIPLPDAKEIRRATSAFRWLTADRGKIKTEIARAAIDAAADIVTKVWQPLQLFRAAWLTRVSMDEVGGRMGAAGLRGLNHPWQYLRIMLGGAAEDGVLAGGRRAAGQITQDLSGQSFRTAQGAGGDTFRGTMNQGRAGWSEPFAGRRAGGGGRKKAPFVPNVTPDHPKFVNVWVRDSMVQMWNEPVFQRVAGGLDADDMASLGRFDPLTGRRATAPAAVVPAHPSSFDALSEWFWTGGGADLRHRIGATAGDDVRPILTDRAFADEYLKTRYIKRMMGLTGGDDELIESIATGQIRGINVRQLDFTGRRKFQMTPAERAAERNRLRKVRRVYGTFAEKKNELQLTGTLPKYVKAAIEDTKPGWRNQANTLVDTFFEVGFSKPNDLLSKSPTYRQFYYKGVEELIPHLDTATKRLVLQRAKAAQLPKADFRRLAALALRSEGGVIDTIESADMMAHRFARTQTKKLLYDVAERGQYAEVLRITNPFLEAWKEMFQVWGRLAVENPKIVRRGQQLVEGARSSGFFYTDEVTGKEMFAYPGGELITNLGLRIFGAPTLPEGAAVPLTGQVAGLNLAGNILPGFGPIVTLPAQALLDPEDPELKDLRGFLLPFGADDSIWDAFAPAYVKRLQTWFANDPEKDAMLKSTQVDVMRMLSATGEYTDSTTGQATEAELARLVGDSTEIARKMFLIRGMAQFALPTGPSPRFTAQGYALGELAKWLRDKTVELGGDHQAAFDAFVNEFGWELSAATQGKSRSVAPRPTSTAGYAWIQNNRQLTETLPFTVGLAAPEQDGPFDIEAFIGQYGDTRESVTPRQWGELRNNTLGWQAYEHVKTLAKDLPEAQRDAALGAVKAELMVRYPGFNSAILGLTERPEVEQMVDELRRWPDHPQIMATDAGKAVATYMGLRQQAVDALAAQGFRGESTLLQANAGFPYRQALRAAASALAERQPAFTPVWRYVLERELEQGNADQEKAA